MFSAQKVFPEKGAGNRQFGNFTAETEIPVETQPTSVFNFKEI